jgi:hypothetical protein
LLFGCGVSCLDSARLNGAPKRRASFIVFGTKRNHREEKIAILSKDEDVDVNGMLLAQ